MRYSALLLAAFALSGCGIPLGAGTWIESKLYSGDGHISTCSTLFAAGYFIDFPPFDPTKTYTARYRVSHLPHVGRSPYICLRFHSNMSPSTDELKKHVSAALRFRLTDPQGHELQTISMPLSAAIWGHESPDFFQIWDFDHGQLRVQSNADYILEASYKPGDFPPQVRKVYLQLQDCASY
jgi:hypothetical protein